MSKELLPCKNAYCPYFGTGENANDCYYIDKPIEKCNYMPYTFHELNTSQPVQKCKAVKIERFAVCPDGKPTIIYSGYCSNCNNMIYTPFKVCPYCTLEIDWPE